MENIDGVVTVSRNEKGFDYRDNPEDMDTEYLLELSYQLYARTRNLKCNSEFLERHLALRNEISRRLEYYKK